MQTGAPSNDVPRRPRSLPSVGRTFDWQDLSNTVYLDYIAGLRAVGCPEKQIRAIVVSDVDTLFDRRRLEHALKTDSQWWRFESFLRVLSKEGFPARFDAERRALLSQLLGEEVANSLKLTPVSSAAINLTGPILGALPVETWNSVQEIYTRSMERDSSYKNQRLSAGEVVEEAVLAKMRDSTRRELALVLTPEQLEEFLLRYSHNASQLRQEMHGIDLSPDEFRRFFRAIDPLQHQTQLEYGGLAALSQKQREQLEAQRDRIARETMTPAHFALYLTAKDPLFKQAQSNAVQYGLNGKSVQPLYQMQKDLDAKRGRIADDISLSEVEKNQALQAIGIEHQQILERILGDVNHRD